MNCRKSRMRAREENAIYPPFILSAPTYHARAYDNFDNCDQGAV